MPDKDTLTHTYKQKTLTCIHISKKTNTHINTTMLHQDDLIFCKTESGVTSCGYNISNMLLKNTLNMPHSQYGHHTGNINKTSKDDIRIAKLMEDLVVPSGLYYCHPMTKHKVFNYKYMQAPQSPRSPQSRENGENGEKDEINITNGMIDESVYDKLLSLVSMDKKKLFDRKTRKNTHKTILQKVIDNSGSIDSDIPMDVPVVLDTPRDTRADKGEKGEKGEKANKKKSLKLKIKLKPQQDHNQEQNQNQKQNQRKTKKVRFA